MHSCCELYEPAGVLITRTLPRSDWGKLGWTLVIYSGRPRPRCREHLLLIFSSRTPGVGDEGVPGPRHWRHVSAGSSGRKLSRLQTWRERESGPLWRKVRYWGFDENVLIFKIIVGLSSSEFIHKCFTYFSTHVYSLYTDIQNVQCTCLHKIISSANNTEARHGMSK